MLDKEFLWGASTSAYQVEGAIDVDGKGLSVQDVKDIIKDTSDFKVCVDHYNRFKEDIKLFSELGLKSYRFSIAWTRIIPNGIGEVNEKGIKFYNDLIDECLKYNIEPFVTLYHFDLPYELEKKGGWSNRETIDAFVEFSRIVFENYGDRVKYFLTINEQNMMILHGPAILGGSIDKPMYKDLANQNHHMLLAQAKCIKLYHSMKLKGKIGPAPNIAYVYPKTSKPTDVLASQNYNAIRNFAYLDIAVWGRYNPIYMNYLKKYDAIPDIECGDMDILASAKPDFIAFNYYYTSTVTLDTKEKSQMLDKHLTDIVDGFYALEMNDYLENTEFGWQVDPVGFKITIRELYQRYNLPLVVTENGLGANDVLEADGSIHDDYRIKYLREHIQMLKEAVDEGCEVFGYFPWSAIDLISTHQGFRKRYGFVYVNRDEFDLKDLKRYKKDSFYWYNNVIKTNGEEL